MTTSKIFKELTAEEIEKVIKNLYGNHTKIEGCRLLKGGLFNTTYFVKTNSDRVGIVLRVAPINKHLLLDFEKNMMSAESTFYTMLKENNIPSSEVIHYDNSADIIDREYIVFRYIPSFPMNEVSVSAEVKTRLYHQLGEIIASFHDIQSGKFGWLRPKDELGMYAKWSAFIRQFTQEIADKTSIYGIFSDTELTRYLDVFSNTALFDQVVKANMIHADFWEGNVLVSENKEGSWEVVALIDVDKAIFGDREMEYSSPVMRNEDFLSGYGYEFSKSSSAIFRRSAYQLLERFMYAYIWRAQFEHIERSATAKIEGLAILGKIETSM
jgi:aminoglycoside phosphotransferase (APT) family kinase protein